MVPTLSLGQLPSDEITKTMDLIQYLQSYQGQLDAFIKRFPSGLYPALSKASSEVLGKLSLYKDEDIHLLLESYQFYRKELGTVSPGSAGWLDLWKILTLIQLARPDWSIKNVLHYSNFGMNKSYYYILYSLHQDTMPEIILELGERFFESSFAYFEDRMFSRLLILENSLSLSEDQNLCSNCKEDVTLMGFDRIITDFGRPDIYSRWGISRNQVGDVRIVCFKCLQTIVLNSDSNTVVRQLQEVI